MSRISQHLCILLGLLLLGSLPACVDSELRFRLGEGAQAPTVGLDATTDGGGAKDGSGGDVTAKDTKQTDVEEVKDTAEDIKVDVGPPPPVPCEEDADCTGSGFDPGLCAKPICDLITGFCRGEPISGCCTSSPDCVDEELCTIDTCVGGQCFHAPAEGCCTLDSQCDDEDPCSLDICTADFACGVDPSVNLCCESNDECDDGLACSVDICEDGVCTGIYGEDCCIEDDNCTDDIGCTIDTCEPNNTCGHSQPPGCCIVDNECEDGDGCTKNLCVSGVCQAGSQDCCAFDNECSDGKPCTQDGCIDQLCVFAPQDACCASDDDCDDNDVCTDQSCDVDTGFCSYTESEVANCCDNPADCQDGDNCTFNDCKEGFCVESLSPGCCLSNDDCEDTGDACTTQQCDVASGKCKTFQICCDENVDCHDDNVCTVDTCVEGECSNSVDPECCANGEDCEDDDPCTNDSCQGGFKCIHSKIGGCCSGNIDCLDDSPCTTDICKDNACSNKPLAGCCEGEADCDDKPCQTASCTNGGCTYDETQGCCLTNAGCADQNVCTDNTCEDQVCVSNDKDDCCLIPGGPDECQDGDPCTLNVCETDNTCTSLPQCCDSVQDCETGDPCLSAECNDGQCILDTISDTCCSKNSQCGDGDPCTNDTCNLDTNLCVNVVPPGAEGCCQSSDDCEAVEGVCLQSLCLNGTCSTEQQPECCETGNADCNDGVGCTEDVCDLSTNSCSHEPLQGCCTSDNDCLSSVPCVNGTCDLESGECLSDPTDCACASDSDCDDDKPCTQDQCIGNTQCINEQIAGCCTPQTNFCDDNDPCTENNCEANKCTFPGIDNCCDDAGDCPDSGPCATDFCSPFTKQCSVTFDFTGCCIDDIHCEPSGNLCLTTTCGLGNSCVDTPIPGCNPDACTSNEDCEQDDNPCTESTCAPGVGCSIQNVPGGCDDDDVCTPVDFCVNGSCTGTGTLGCDDGNECTTDTCVAGVGCSNPPKPGPCDDGDPCTDGDTCTAGGCIPGQPLTCPDTGNPCTDNTCNSGSGCEVTFNEEPCDDEDLCTVGDQCKAGACVSGTPTICEDNPANPCIEDACDPDTGACTSNQDPGCCIEAGDCDDGVPCTNDSCQFDPSGSSNSEFTCVNSADFCCEEQADCVDGNPCTDDICEDGLGGGGFNGKCLNPLKPGQCCLASDCDDDNPCTNDLCTPDGCVNSFEDTQFESCVPALPCQGPDGQCINGECLASVSEEVICDDDDPCTTDSCDQVTGFCTQSDIPNCCVADGDCGDTDPCTADTCLEAFCDGEIQGDTCYKVETEPGTWFEAQTGCAAWGGQLVSIHSLEENVFIHDLKENEGCGDTWIGLNDLSNEDAYAWSDGTPFDFDAFSSGEPNDCIGCCGGTPEDVVEMWGGGVCEASGNNCEDDDQCGAGDTCIPGSWNDLCSFFDNPCYVCARPVVSAGQCQNVEQLGCCTQPNDPRCEDDNPCTNSGTCDFADPGNPLEPGTGSCGDEFITGCCLSGVVDCDDGDDCTDDVCDPVTGQCQNNPNLAPGCCNSDLDCDDEAFCNGEETCGPGNLCVPGSPPLCNDGVACTSDSCNPDIGSGDCENTPQSTECDDDDACNGLEVCDLIAGCVAGDGIDCDDEDACNGVETCATGECQPGVPLTCDDGDTCNGAETCNPDSGCTAGSALNCDDGDVCSGVEGCDPVSGCTAGAPLSCDDGVFCNGVESCDSGLGCVSDGEPVCDDGKACSVDSCDADLDACVFDESGCCTGNADCDDGDDCTIDFCSVATGLCSNPKHDCCENADCDEGEPCTIYTCEVEETLFFTTKGCVEEPNFNCCTPEGGECDDGNSCTIDECAELIPGVLSTCDISPNPGGEGCCSTPLDCNPGVCEITADCQNSKCVFVPQTTDGCCLVDGDCEQDECFTSSCGPEGICEQELNLLLDDCCLVDGDCDDGNDCTTNTCGADNTCAFTFTGGDGCCVEDEDCDDVDPCTTDTCNSGGACSHTPTGALPGVVEDCGPSGTGNGVDDDCNPDTVCYEVTSDFGATALIPSEGAEGVNAYYGLSLGDQNAAADHGFEISNAISVHLYRDTNQGNVYLIYTLDQVDDGSIGNLSLNLAGANGMQWLVFDDPGDDYSIDDLAENGVASASWSWVGCCTDGFALGPLAGDFCLDFTHPSSSGIDGVQVFPIPDPSAGVTLVDLGQDPNLTFQLCGKQ